MVAHDREGQTIDGENRREKLKPISNPLAPVFEGFPCKSIFPAKKSSSDTTTGDMNDLYGLGIEIFAAS